MLGMIRQRIAGFAAHSSKSSAALGAFSSEASAADANASTMIQPGKPGRTAATRGMETDAWHRYQISNEKLRNYQIPPSLERMLSIFNGDAKEQKQAQKRLRMDIHSIRPGDTGSTPVQVACLSVRIDHVNEHCHNNRQDKVAKRTQLRLVTRRRRLLQYLRRKDYPAYERTLVDLNLPGFPVDSPHRGSHR